MLKRPSFGSKIKSMNAHLSLPKSVRGEHSGGSRKKQSSCMKARSLAANSPFTFEPYYKPHFFRVVTRQTPFPCSSALICQRISLGTNCQGRIEAAHSMLLLVCYHKRPLWSRSNKYSCECLWSINKENKKTTTSSPSCAIWSSNNKQNS